MWFSSLGFLCTEEAQRLGSEHSTCGFITISPSLRLFFLLLPCHPCLQCPASPCRLSALAQRSFSPLGGTAQNGASSRDKGRGLWSQLDSVSEAPRHPLSSSSQEASYGKLLGTPLSTSCSQQTGQESWGSEPLQAALHPDRTGPHPAGPSTLELRSQVPGFQVGHSHRRVTSPVTLEISTV